MKKKVRPARCRQVQVILGNKLETVRLIREVVYPQTGGDVDTGPLEVAVVRFAETEVFLPLESVVFVPDVHRRSGSKRVERTLKSHRGPKGRS